MLNRYFQMSLAPNCPFDLYIWKFHLLYHLVDELDKSERISTIDKKRFEHCVVRIKCSYEMTSGGLYKRTHGSLQSLAEKMHGVGSDENVVRVSDSELAVADSLQCLQEKKDIWCRTRCAGH